MSTVVKLVPLRDQRRRAGECRPASTWPIKELEPATPSAWLMSTIEGRSYAPIALSLWLHHPNLRIATETLAAYLTPKWPNSKGESLLSSTIETAVCKVEAAVQRGESFEGRVIGVYLFWLVKCIEDVARLGVHGVTKNGELLHWQYFSEPLFNWAKRHDMLELEANLMDPEPTTEQIAGLRTHLIARITAHPVDAGYLEMHAPRG